MGIGCICLDTPRGAPLYPEQIAICTALLADFAEVMGPKLATMMGFVRTVN